MKARRRRPAEPARRVRIDRRAVETVILLQLENLEELPEIGECDVEGAFVKVCPRIAASERDRFDGPAIARHLRECGALAVTLAPVIVPDAKTAARREIAAHMKPREMVDAWLAEQHLEDVERDSIRDLVLAAMDSEGL